MISAHWEHTVPAVTAQAAPGLLFDYYGFPPETYRYTYPAPGSPALAQEVATALGAAGIEQRSTPSATSTTACSCR